MVSHEMPITSYALFPYALLLLAALAGLISCRPNQPSIERYISRRANQNRPYGDGA